MRFASSIIVRSRVLDTIPRYRTNLLTRLLKYARGMGPNPPRDGGRAGGLSQPGGGGKIIESIEFIGIL